MSVQLQLSEVSVAYGRNEVVKRVSFTLEGGDLGCLIGPSGCGKSTLLRAIAGFEPVTSGEIELHGRQVSRVGYTQPPERRRIGMVFQDFALFPHLTVEDNIAFGLRRQRREQRRQRVSELLSLIGLPGIARHYPHQLSGGQQQRVALARALAPKPQLLLLDEPFSSLDAELREQLASEVREVLRREGVTGLMVTHDQEEALGVAERIGVLYHGQLLQWDTPYAIYHAPQHRFVADFIGRGVFAPGLLRNERQVETELGCFTTSTPPLSHSGGAVDVLLRPDDLIPGEEGPFRGQVVARRYCGAEYLYTVRLKGGTELLCPAPSHFPYEVGDEIGLTPALREVVVFPRSTSEDTVKQP